MRKVVIRQVSQEPEDEERHDRLTTLLATGLERLLAQEQGEKPAPEPVDYLQTLSPTSDTDA